jgi:hypothetical protein
MEEKTITIHSANPVGVENMKGTIEHYRRNA